MIIDYHAITHPGRVRTQNEDAYLVSNLDGEEPLVNGLHASSPIRQSGILAAVADGMGGAATGRDRQPGRAGLGGGEPVRPLGRLPAAKAVESDLLRALRHAVEAASARCTGTRTWSGRPGAWAPPSRRR